MQKQTRYYFLNGIKQKWNSKLFFILFVCFLFFDNCIKPNGHNSLLIIVISGYSYFDVFRIGKKQHLERQGSVEYSKVTRKYFQFSVVLFARAVV